MADKRFGSSDFSDKATPLTNTDKILIADSSDSMKVKNAAIQLFEDWLNTFLSKENITGLKTSDSPQFVTAKLTGLTDGFFPYHENDANGLKDSAMYQSTGGLIGINDTSAATLGSALNVKSLSGSTNVLRLSTNDYAASVGTVALFQFGAASGDTELRLNVLDGGGLSNANLVFQNVSGNVGIGATSPTAKLDINGDTLRLRTAKTPASATATGNAGDIAWDSSYIYVCVAANTWKRVAISTW